MSFLPPPSPALSSFNPSLYAMAIENCFSDWDVPLIEFHRRLRKRQRISSQANMRINDLETDLLVEILIRLPNPRSSSHCKLVCKRWDSLISSPPFNRRFISHHLTMHRPHMPLDPYELKSIILSFLPPLPCSFGNALTVLDCNKDLVLCGFWDVDCDDGERGRSYLVCNPFTKQWIALPLAPRKHVGYVSPAARLVCEPRISNKLDVGGGDDDQEAAFVCSEYRFRVVCIYQVAVPHIAFKLDMFCSESGQWTKEALVSDKFQIKRGLKGVISCNGELFWMKSMLGQEVRNSSVAVFNPFRLDKPPTSIDSSAFRVYPLWFISSSQGVLHVIALENQTAPARASIWRLEEGRKSWRKQYEGLVNETSKCGNYQIECFYRPFLHPDKPEIVFFNPLRSDENSAILCCDLRTGEVEFFAKVEGKPDVYHLQVFQPRVSCWATPIPRYEALRGLYDGSYSFWVQSTSKSKSKTHSVPPLLNICKFMKSTFYKDYMKNVTEEATLDIVAEIIQRRKKKISNEIIIRERQLPLFPYDKELDELETVLRLVEADMVTIGKHKEEVMCKTSSTELLYPPVSIKSVCTRNMVVPSRKRQLGGMVITERKQPRFADDKEAGFKDVVSYVAAVGNPKEVEQGLLCETWAELPDHPVSIKSVSADLTPNIPCKIHGMVLRERLRKIHRMVIRERKQPRFPDDKEADFEDVDSYMTALVKWKELSSLMSSTPYIETSAEIPHPLVPISKHPWYPPCYILPLHRPAPRGDWEKEMLLSIMKRVEIYMW